MTAQNRLAGALMATVLMAAPLCEAADKPVTMRVTLKKQKVCRGESRLDLTIEFHNPNKDAVAVLFQSVGYNYSYHPEPKIKPGEERAEVGFYGVTPISGESDFIIIPPEGSEKREVNIALPSKAPPQTSQLDLTLFVRSEPKEKKYQGEKTFKGVFQTRALTIHYPNCPAPGPN